MADDKPQSDVKRQRPAHWAHPVDERGRLVRARRARRRRVVLVVLVILVVAVFSLHYYLTSDERVEQFAEAYLEDMLGTHVGIGRASFSLAGGLVLEDLTVRAPPPFKEPILTALRVNLEVDPLSLLRLVPKVTEIVVHQPRITLVLRDGTEWNFQRLIRARPAKAKAPAIRPVVALDEGTLRVVRKRDGRTEYEHEMQVSGLLLPSEADRHTFRFQTDVRSREVHLAVASGLLDARTGALRFEGNASNVVLSEQLFHSLPGEVQAAWSRFDPKGTINGKLLFDETHGFRLVAEMTGVEFAYPYKGLTHRFENLTGRCTFESHRLILSDVQGLMNGWPITLDGEVAGFDQAALTLDLRVSADRVDAEKCRPLLISLVPHLVGLYDAYAPKGRADLDLNIVRGPESADRLEVSGSLTCRDMQMTYRLFPYRLDNLRGTVQFSPTGYTAKNMVGRHGDATVHLQGWTRNPGPLHESRVTVHGEGVLLDEDLRAALGERQRRIYDLYAPSGVADVDVEIHRPPGEDARREIGVTLNLKDCGFLYRDFPYRLQHTTGKVIIGPERTEIVDVRGRHGDAVITLEGELAGPADGTGALTLRVTGTGVALDQDLETALPERQRSILQAFHLSGRADFEGTVTREPETADIHYDLDIHLRGARMIYEPFPILVDEVTGEIHLTRNSCRIESLTGFNSGARIEATGWIEQRPDDYAMDLTLAGEDVALGESLRGALGPELRSVWSHLAPRGRVEVSAHLEKDFGPDEKVRHHVWVTMHDAQATLDVFPLPLEHVTGQMEFRGGEVWLHDLRARSGLARFRIAGRIGYEETGPRLDLRIHTEGLRFEGPLRNALPGPLKKAFAVIRPAGRVDLDLRRLAYRVDEDGMGHAEWDGTVVLDEVAADPGVQIAGVVGTADLLGRWDAGQVTLDGNLRIQQGEVAGKNIQGTHMRVRKMADAKAVVLESIEGECYGGRMEGFAAIGVEPGGRYALNLAVTGVDFERLLRDGFRLEHNISGGRLEGTLGLRAGSDGTQASGFLRVTDAELYELPVVVRLLNVFRLAPDERTAFQKARVLYFLRGGRLYLGDVRLEGRAINLYGTGIMEKDGRLDLLFLTGKKDDDPLLPALSELLEGVRKQLVVVVVTGTLSEPQVEFRTLSALTAPIREVLDMVRAQRAREGGAP